MPARRLAGGTPCRASCPKVLAASDGACSSVRDRACLSARDRASETASTSPPKAPQPQLRGFLRPQAPVFVCLPQVRSRETRYVCVLIAPGAVAPETSNTFPQVTAPRITPLATHRALKHRRIASPARLRPRARLPPACGPVRACNACASAAFRACFASVEALLTRTLSGCARTLEPTMQTVQTDRSTLAR